MIHRTLPLLLMLALASACSSSHPQGIGDGAPPSADGGLLTPPPDGAAPLEDGGPPPPERDAGAPAIDGGPPPTDAAIPDPTDAGGHAGSVWCGPSPCAVPGLACRASCRTGGASTPTCVAVDEPWEIGECPTDEPDFPVVVARCDGPEDCPVDEACLVQRGSIGNYPQCGCEGRDGRCLEDWSVVLCHTLADCPSGSTACAVDTTYLGGFYRTCVR